MSEFGTGNKATSDVGQFLTLTNPVYLPTLASENGNESPFLPVPQLRMPRQLSGWTDIPPERQGVDFGQVDYFKYILNDSEVLSDLWLCVRLDSLEAGFGGEHPRYPDDPIASAIHKIEFIYAKTTPIQVLTGDQLHIDHCCSERPEVRARLDPMYGCNVPVGKRIENAKKEMWYYRRIPFWWTKRPYDAWHQYTFQRLTRIVVHWRRGDEILQQEIANTRPTPTGRGNYILDHFLRFRVHTITEAAKMAYIRNVTDFGLNGQLYLIEDTQELVQQVNRNQERHIIQLNTFTKFGYNLRFYIRKVSSLMPNYLDNDRWQFIPVNTFGLEIAGKKFMPNTDVFWTTHAQDEAMFKGNPDYDIYNIPFTDNPDVTGAAMGGIDFSQATTPQVIIETMRLPDDCHVSFVLQCHNYVRVTITNGQTAADTVQGL